MLLYLVSGGFFLLFILSVLAKDSASLQPTNFLLYGMTSMMMAMILKSNYMPVFIFRFFLYLISGFIIIIIPFLLLAIALLVIKRLLSPPAPSTFRIIFSLVIGITLLAFVGFTIYGLLYWSNERVQEIIAIYSLLALYITSTFLCYIFLNFLIALWPHHPDIKNIVVLGSQLNEIGDVTDLLKSRLDRSVEIYHKQREQKLDKVIIIVTGGPEGDSKLSEAEGMRTYLITQGIPEEDILLEPHARNTYENFTNVRKILGQEKMPGRVLIITSRFHLVRSIFIARQAHFRAYFEGAKTPIYLWPYSIVREYLAYIILTREMNYAFIVLLIIQGLYDILL